MKIELISQWKPNFNVCCVSVGKVFENQRDRLLLGTNEGIIVLSDGKSQLSEYNSKGDAIQSIFLENFTKLPNRNEMAIGDSKGNVVLFSDGKILSRICINSPISCMELDNEGSIIVGDCFGSLTAFEPPDVSDKRWKIRIQDNLDFSSQFSSRTGQLNSYEPKMRHCFQLSLLDKAGLFLNSLLVVDGSALLHFYSDQSLIQIIPMACKINAACKSVYLSENDQSPCVLLGGENGVLYVMNQRQQIMKYARLPNSISLISSFRPKNRTYDCVVVCSHSNTLHIFDNQKLILEFELEDWPEHLGVGDINEDGESEIIVCLQNNTIQTFKIIV